MNTNLLGANIRRLRTLKNLSQKRLAELSGLSTPAVTNLENGKVSPKMNTLEKLAKALDVSLGHFFKPAKTLKSVRFRSNKQLQYRANIISEVSIWIDDYNELEDMVGNKNRYFLGNVDFSGLRDPEGAADLCREKLDIQLDEPIRDICGLIESAGIKVYSYVLASNSFFGLSVAQEDGGPAVIVNTWERIPVERWIFSAAHELGHLLLHKCAYDVDSENENDKEEIEANLFAGQFLMPTSVFLKEWEQAAGLGLIDRVLKIKSIFKVSYKTVLMRLTQQGLADKGIWSLFSDLYYAEYGKRLSFTEEPAPIKRSEPSGLGRYSFLEERLSKLTRMAIEQDKISMGRGAEILKISLKNMSVLMKQWQTVQKSK